MNGQQFEIRDFSKVKVEGACSAEIVKAASFEVRIPAEYSSYVKLEKAGDTLTIGRRGVAWVALLRSRPHIFIGMPRLDELVLSGASYVKAQAFQSEGVVVMKLSGASHLEVSSMASGSLRIDVSGASNLSGDIKTSGDGEFRVTGASRIELAGSGNNAKIELSGASQARLANFSLNSASINASGASNAQLKVNASMEVSLSGASRLEYTGNPALGNMAVSGASCLKHR
ncbi:MAG: hypothetical protein A2Z29_09620 [Chloroflexi bacterium RBG_16_56_11]|nr:MAG: hypothetical protein A2Z29_09620 [Chloroflexi bacterium RBG_16_56_11]